MNIFKISKLFFTLTGLVIILALSAPPANALNNRAPKGNPSGKVSEVSSSQINSAQTSVQPPVCQYSACFYYVGARQDGLSATGAYASFTQAQPIVDASDYHSLTELAVQSTDGKQVIEVGWTVDKGVNGDSVPHLFVFHWVNGTPKCYNACGFVSLNGSVKAGSALPVGAIGRFAIIHSGSRWNILYNSVQVGYFPDTLWNGGFTKTGTVQVFGEVAASATAQPKTQMGNGVLGSLANSAAISNYGLFGSTISPSLSHYIFGDANIYNYGQATSLGLRYGGPGY